MSHINYIHVEVVYAYRSGAAVLLLADSLGRAFFVAGASAFATLFTTASRLKVDIGIESQAAVIMKQSHWNNK